MTTYTIPDFKTLISKYIFAYAYPIAFVGAVCMSIIEIVGFIPATIVNEKLVIFINIIIGLSGLLSVFNWFNQPIPLFGDAIIDRTRVKETSTS
jgi:hypothetical protein